MAQVLPIRFQEHLQVRGTEVSAKCLFYGRGISIAEVPLHYWLSRDTLKNVSGVSVGVPLSTKPCPYTYHVHFTILAVYFLSTVDRHGGLFNTLPVILTFCHYCVQLYNLAAPECWDQCPADRVCHPDHGVRQIHLHQGESGGYCSGDNHRPC